MKNRLHDSQHEPTKDWWFVKMIKQFNVIGMLLCQINQLIFHLSISHFEFVYEHMFSIIDPKFGDKNVLKVKI